jgi:hypothetical protein
MIFPARPSFHAMAKHVVHISEAEAASDFASLMARVRSGAEVVIEENARAPLPSCVPRNPMSDCSPNLFALPENMVRRQRSMGISEKM